MSEQEWRGLIQQDVDEIEQHVTHLEPGDGEKVQIDKELLSELPPRFEESYPANAMQDGAEASYRSTEEGDVVHVIEYEEHWEVHLDEFNPKHDPIKHLINDAPGEALLIGLVLIGLGHKYAGE
jgi:hypothetical protein